MPIAISLVTQDKCFIILALSTFDGKVLATVLGHRHFNDAAALAAEIRSGCGHIISARHLDDIIESMVANYGTADVVYEVLGGGPRLRELLDLYNIGLGEYGRRHPPTPPEEGAQAQERYSPISEQGSGGMGRVLVVHDTRIGRDIALKELLPQSQHSGAPADSPVRATAAVASRFLQEGYVTARLEHPNIVPVYEVGQRTDGSFYYTMRLVRGRSLRDALSETRNLDERLAYLHNFREICQAISYAHSRGVLHRDIKPSNVMIGDFGETVVIDWGLAKVRELEDPFAQEMGELPSAIREQGEFTLPDTLFGEAIGTPHYMSPEQAAGKIDQVDERSDVFSLGVILYQMLAGVKPFDGYSLESILAKVIVCDPLALSDLGYAGPPELAAICAKAMAREKEHRYQSANQLLNDIVSFQTGALVSSYSYGGLTLLRRLYRKHRAVVWTLSLSAAAIAVVGAVAVANVVRARQHEHEARLLAESAAQRAQEQADYANLQFVDAAMKSGSRAEAAEALDRISEAKRGWEWGHFQKQLHEAVATIQLEGEGDYLFSSFLSSPQQLLTVQNTGKVCWWSESGDIVKQTEDRKVIATVASIAPGEGHVAVGFQNGDVFVYPTTGEPKHTRVHLEDAVTGLAWAAPDALLVADRSGSVSLFRGESNIWTAPCNTIPWGLQAEPGGAAAVAVSSENSLRFLDVSNGEESEPLPGGRGDFNAEGSLYLTQTGEDLRLYDVASRQLKWRVPRQPGPIPPVLSEDASLCAALSADGGIEVYTAEGQHTIGFATLWDAFSMRFLGNDRLLVAGRRSGVSIYDSTSGAALSHYAGSANNFVAAVADAGHGKVAAVSGDGAIQLFNLSIPAAHSVVAAAPSPIIAIATAASGLAYGTRDSTLYTVDAAGAARSYQGFNEDGLRHIAAMGGDHWVCNLDAFTPAHIDTSTGTVTLLVPSPGRITAIAGTEKACFVATSDGSLSRWSNQLSPPPVIIELPAIATALAARAGDVVVGLSTGELLSLDAATLNVRRAMGQVEGSIASITAVPGELLLVGTTSGTVAWVDAEGNVGNSTRFKEKVQAIAALGDNRGAALFDYGQLRILHLPTLKTYAAVDSAAAQNALAATGGGVVYTAGEQGIVQAFSALPWKAGQTAEAPLKVAPEQESATTVLLPRKVLESALQALHPQSAAIPATSAVAVSASRRLRLEEGARVVSVGAAETPDAATFEVARAAAVEASRQGQEVTITVEREGKSNTFRYVHFPRHTVLYSVVMSKLEMLSLLDLWLAALQAPGSFQGLRTGQALGLKDSSAELQGLLLPPIDAQRERFLYHKLGIVPDDVLYALDENALGALESVAPGLRDLRKAVSGGTTTVALHLARGDFQLMDININLVGVRHERVSVGVGR